ncbi:hypothetical protein ACX3P1_10120 [Mesorhizobium sp. A623]
MGDGALHPILNILSKIKSHRIEYQSVDIECEVSPELIQPRAEPFRHLMCCPLADGSKLRLLTVIDMFTREALAVGAGPRLRGEQGWRAEPPRQSTRGAHSGVL